MNLSQLYYFRKLAELQHYTRAAKELYITQPTLSGSIASLEQELGVALFQKKGRNVELTKYGAEFLVYVNEALEKLDKGIAVMHNYSGDSDAGSLDIGCIVTVQIDYLPKLLTDYRVNTNHEAYEFNIEQKTSGVLLEGLGVGTYDVAFCAKDDDVTGINYVPVVEQELVVAMSANCELANKEFIVPEDLEGLSSISYRENIPLGKSVKRLCGSLGIDNVRYNFDDESILAGFAIHGVDAAIMLDTFFLKNVDNIIVRPFYNNAKDKKSFYHTIYLAYSSTNYHPYCVENFIEYVESNPLKAAEDHLYFD